MADIKYLDKTGLTTVKSILDGLFATKSHAHSKGEIGLGNVDNTADKDKNVKYATSAGYADDSNLLDGKDSTYFDTAPFSTIRDFTLGTLIKTDINYSVTSGDPFYVEIKGNTYISPGSMHIQIQGYIYNDTIINYSVTSLGVVYPSEIIAKNVGGYLCFWFPRIAYWHGYYIKVTTGYNYSVNRVTNVLDSAEPSGTKRVVLTSTFYTNYSNSNLTISGGGAAGGSSLSIKANSTTYSLTIPTALPASDVYSWAKAAAKPSYNAGEVGALPFFKLASGNANDLSQGLTTVTATITNQEGSNHSTFLTITDIGTPFQLQIPDSNINYIYKRYKSGSTWSAWTKLSAGYADTAGSAVDQTARNAAAAAQATADGKAPASHSHDYLPSLRLTNPSSGTANTGAIPFILALKAAGTPVYDDPEFKDTNNSCNVYNNSGNGNVTITRITDDQNSANSSGYILKIYNNGGTTSPSLGGFYQTIQSRAGAVFCQIFRAKIPVGYSVTNAENHMGDNYTTYWLTDRSGTGKWEWYCRVTICGITGSMSSGGHVYLEGTGPVTWYMSYCNLIDLSKGDYDGLRVKYADSASSASSASSATYATSSNYSKNLLGRNTSGSDYSATDGNLIFAEWNTHGDNRWYLKAAGYETRTGYATNSSNLSGYSGSSYFAYRGWDKTPGKDANVAMSDVMGSNFSYANNCPYTGPLLTFNCGGYNLQLNGAYSANSGKNLAFRLRNGDHGTNHDWYTICHSGNIADQSVNYATSAGSANSATKATQDSDGNAINSTYLKKSGGTLTGALTFANGTWNVVGDDAAIGDYNVAGSLGLKSVNNNIPSIGFHNSSSTLLGTLKCETGTLKWNTNTILDSSNYNSHLPVKLINDPGQTVLKNSYGLNASYGSSSYGHPTEEYLKAFAKYLQATAPGSVCIGQIGPNSQGAYISHVYNSGTNSTTGFPEHITCHFFNHGGSHYTFGTSYGNWYYYGFSTTSHTHSSVIDAGNNSSSTTFAYSKSGLNYADYTWLAGWNGYELRAVNKTQFAQASHSHSNYLSLDGGAMNNQNVVTNLNADLLDGYSGSAYSRKAANETFSGTKTFSASPTFSAGFSSSANVTITGSVTASQGFFDTSDERLKDFYNDIDVDFGKLKSIPKKYFSWKDDENKEIHLGTSAQGVQAVYPEIVNDNDGTLTVDYSKLSVVALAAIDKLYDENQELKSKISTMEERLAKLEKLLGA